MIEQRRAITWTLDPLMTTTTKRKTKTLLWRCGITKIWPSLVHLKEPLVQMVGNFLSFSRPKFTKLSSTGEFVCFFRAPPRIVRNVLRGSRSDSPTKPSTPQDSSSTVNIYQSPSLVADAVGRLAAIASDRSGKSADSRQSDNGENILRVMTNFFTFSQERFRHNFDSRPQGEGPDHRVIPLRRSTLSIGTISHIAGSDKKVALRYVFQSHSLSDVCARNAVVAREYRRFDHERIFITLGALFHVEGPVQDTDWIVKSSPLIWQVIRRLYVSLVMYCGRLWN